MKEECRSRAYEKTTEELICLWKEQKDYRQEFVKAVASELTKRNIDVTQIEIQEETKSSLKEKQRERNLNHIALRVVAVLLAIGCIVGTFIFVEAFQEALSTHQIFKAIAIAIDLSLLIILFFISFGIWLKKYRACVAGLIVLALTVLGKLVAIITALAQFISLAARRSIFVAKMSMSNIFSMIIYLFLIILITVLFMMVIYTSMKDIGKSQNKHTE